jgi:hypothetical protein
MTLGTQYDTFLCSEEGPAGAHDDKEFAFDPSVCPVSVGVRTMEAGRRAPVRRPHVLLAWTFCRNASFGQAAGQQFTSR